MGNLFIPRFLLVQDGFIGFEGMQGLQLGIGGTIPLLFKFVNRPASYRVSAWIYSNYAFEVLFWGVAQGLELLHKMYGFVGICPESYTRIGRG